MPPVLTGFSDQRTVWHSRQERSSIQNTDRRVLLNCGIEQRLAHQAHNLGVGGSNPSPATNGTQKLGRQAVKKGMGQKIDGKPKVV